ncbi:MAG: hypothetical protein UW51_C0009G0002 [Candidatus Amesbacteria bacterium GW2011_GWA1_44_24]|uniref:Uncharacterized protein n=1 Tax=Candidatus Woesebacteria bacterium GW2011_GWB1_38_8 TaxID=1618570 RepID=A0A0G0L8X5_9BACT|nr:MAG: hypothetical protein UT08_C0019G0004 [Candidatus Woesebacteria bacterium GW2011_GWB1_38_8]KKT57496.1 MAG: hypothetical protein UW51_C0009G0002 [Candidatus Amesbacteria bacterium GW2011_GWA1_44_24]
MSYKQSLAGYAGKSYKLSRFIANFNFANPDWDNLPNGFFYCKKDGLTKQEGHLLDAIVLAWYATQPEGRKFLSKKFTQTSSLLLISLISLIGLIRLISQNHSDFAKPVQAATTTVNQVIQSTMSAILKK